MVDQFSNQSVPASVHDASPRSVLHSLQSKVKRKIIGELSDEINTESGAAFEPGGVWILYLFRHIYTNCNIR